MSTLTVHLPEAPHRSIEALTAQEGYSIDQFIASAAAKKLATIRTLDRLREDGAAGRREDFEWFLAAVPDGVPAERPNARLRAR